VTPSQVNPAGQAPATFGVQVNVGMVSLTASSQATHARANDPMAAQVANRHVHRAIRIRG
jgi:hypothetical protein